MACSSLARKSVGVTPDEPLDVTELYDGVDRVLGLQGTDGRAAGDCRVGVYLFIDYDGEPIYVGQTREQLRARIKRHLTNQRTDAVANRVLDPFEVAAIEMWPFWDLQEATDEVIKDTLDRAEFTVYQQALADSFFNAVLNEVDIPETELIELPSSVRGEILPDVSRTKREHPDIRIARRARTIADLARVISERKVQAGIRRTLWVQARRLEYLARTRLDDVS